MLKNYFKIAIRNLRRNPGYAALNLVGLSVGMACCVLIALFVKNEYGVNRHFNGADSIFRINSVWHEQGDAVRFLSFSPLAEAMKNEMSGVEDAFRYTGINADLRVDETPLRASVLIADQALFDLFDFRFLAGDRGSALREPGSVVLTESEAVRLFGTKDVLGKTLLISTWGGGGEKPFAVTGVMEDPPFNSVTYIGRNENTVFLPFSNANDFFSGAEFDTDWSVYNTVTYARLTETANPKEVEAQLPALVQERLPDALRGKVSLQLEPMRDVYLNDFGGAARRLARLLLLVAALIMGVACFNYVNLSTAMAVERSREVGMRKVLGASRLQLLGQYLGESVLACALGMALAIGMAQIGLQPFASLVERTLDMTGTTVGFWLILCGITLVVGIVGGMYPAFFLSGLQPVKSLKTLTQSGKTASSIRRGLVVLQFVIAIGLFIAAAVIDRQAAFIARQDVGFDRDQVLVVNTLPREWTSEGVQKLGVIKQAVLDIPGIENASIAWGPPGPRYTGISWEMTPAGGDPDQALAVPISQVDADFLNTVGIELASGAFFNPLRAEGDTAVVLNETAVRLLGLEDPIGHLLTTNDGTFRVIGIVKDYYTEGLERPIGPLALVDVRQNSIYRELLIRMPADRAQESLQSIRSVWQEVYPQVPFDYYFLDEQWHELHRWIWRTQTISRLATTLAIFVACLGLLGIVSIGVGQRAREIGIRKAIGASVSALVGLLSFDFIRLVGLAFLLAAPLAYFAMNRWLEGFANRVDIGAAVFILGGVVVLGLAGLTVGGLAARAALANPVDVLRDE